MNTDEYLRCGEASLSPGVERSCSMSDDDFKNPTRRRYAGVAAVMLSVLVALPSACSLGCVGHARCNSCHRRACSGPGCTAGLGDGNGRWRQANYRWNGPAAGAVRRVHPRRRMSPSLRATPVFVPHPLMLLTWADASGVELSRADSGSCELMPAAVPLPLASERPRGRPPARA